MASVYSSGSSHAVATAVSNVEFSAPFPGINTNYVLRQRFQQLLTNFSPLALNTAYAAPYSDYILVAEDDKADVGALECRWTRTYAKVPATYNQPQTMTYNIIGYVGATAISGATIGAGRNRRQTVVAARVQYDYFLLQTDGKIYDANGTVVYTGPAGLPSLLNVPILTEQRYFSGWIGAVSAACDFDEIGYDVNDAPPGTAITNQIVYPVPDGTTLRPPYAAYPTRGVYERWISKAETVKRYDSVANTITDTGIYEIVATGSQVARWMGNIVERQTVFIRPQ